MSGSLCSLLDTVYRGSVCRRLITPLPPRSGSEDTNAFTGWGGNLILTKTWWVAKLTCAIFCCFNRAKMKECKTEMMAAGLWSSMRRCTTSSCYFCCCTHSAEAEFNYFYIWNTPMIIGWVYSPTMWCSGGRGKSCLQYPPDVRSMYFHCLSPWQHKAVCFHAHSRSSVTRCLIRCQNRRAHSFIK